MSSLSFGAGLTSINKKSESDNMSNFGARKKGCKFIDSDRKIVKGIIKKNKKGK